MKNLKYIMTLIHNSGKNLFIFFLTLIIITLSTPHSFSSDVSSETFEKLRNIENIAQNIYERKTQWEWHEEQIQEHKIQQNMLNNLNNIDREQCKRSFDSHFSSIDYCPEYHKETYWMIHALKDTEKEERIVFAQEYAQEVGLGLFAKDIIAQLHIENDTWDEKRKGDRGCSIGLSQINVCARVSMKNHENLYDWKWQIMSLIDEVKANFIEYKDFGRAQVGWNNPAAMQNGNYKTRYYWKIQNAKELFQWQ